MTQAWDKGPTALFGPGEGQSFWQPAPTGGFVTLTQTTENFKHDAAVCGFQSIPPDGRIDAFAHRAAEKLLYVTRGTGTLTIEGQIHALVPGSMVAMGRKVVHALANDGPDDLELFFWVTPPGFEDYLACAGRLRVPGEVEPAFALEHPAALYRSPVITDPTELAAIQPADKGDWIVVDPEAGAKYWQSAPAGGYIQFKAYPEMFDSNRFVTAIQVLPPGGQIPPHAHSQLEEWLLIRTGHGRAFVDGAWHPIQPGSLGVVSRWITHSILNESDVDMEVLAIATPPGLELLLKEFSLRAEPGDAPPDLAAFTLPEDIDALLEGRVLRMPSYAARRNAEELARPAY